MMKASPTECLSAFAEAMIQRVPKLPIAIVLGGALIAGGYAMHSSPEANPHSTPSSVEDGDATVFQRLLAVPRRLQEVFGKANDHQ